MDNLLEASDEQIEEHYDDLSSHVMSCFDRAKRHRDGIGVTESIQDCLRRYRGKYSKSELCKFEGIDIYLNMTGMIVRSAYSWLKDAYFNAQDRPWTIEPTPEPSLPQSIKIELDEAINNQIQLSLSEGGSLSLPEERKALIAELKNTAASMAYDYAEERTKRMSRVIEDQLLESGYRNVMDEHLLDVCIYPYAVLKAPIVRKKDVPVWDNDNYKFKKETRYDIDRVDPLKFYPSPDSTNCQDGEFLIEIMSMTRSKLNSAKSMKNFKKSAINLVIDEAEDKYERQAQLKIEDNEQTDLDGVGRTSEKTDGFIFDVYEYNGRIPGKYILEWLELEDELDEAIDNEDTVDTDWGVIDPFEDYESTVWVCNDIVIMTRLNSDNPIPYRPYQVTSCFKVPGSIYGESIPMVLADLQDEINVSVRSRIYNTGMSSGPIVEVDVSRFQDNDYPEQLKPWDVIPVQTNSTQGNNSAPAIKFNNVPNVAGLLTSLIQDSWDKAHSIAGIPPYMYGENSGAAPTLGAFSLQYASATKGIKTIISNIDHDIVEKLVKSFYFYNMYYHKDDLIKSDAEVNVRGAAGLIAQEQRQARPLELLQALGPILTQMQPETALALVNETLAESGYDESKLGTAIGRAEREAQNSLVGQNTQPPPVDGRSGQAGQIANANSLPIPQ